MATDRSSAGALLREARVKAGLTQAELAERANITQSVVSAYETGRRQPSLATLERLVRATGGQLEVSVRAARDRHDPMGGALGRTLRRHRSEIEEVAAKHGVTNLRVFGSVARGEDTRDSDVDLLVDLPDGFSLFSVARFQRDLEELLGVRVEVVPASDLKPGVRANVERDLVSL